MPFNLFSKNASRKFVDLIHDVSNKYANLDPPQMIQVGDYGKINNETGQFDREGNIYHNESLAGLAAKNPPVATAAETISINSQNVNGCDFDLKPHLDIGGLAEAPFKTQWQFSDKRGALLIMHSARMTTVPNAFLAYLEKENIDVLKGKDLVISAYSCPAFILYYSNKESETIKIALRMDLPVPAAPALSAGTHFGGTWWSHGCSGLLRMGFHFEECYTPLYQLKSLVEPRRKRGSPTANDSVYWTDTKIPWGYLDEDGEEDTMHDSD